MRKIILMTIFHLLLWPTAVGLAEDFSQVGQAVHEDLENARLEMASTRERISQRRQELASRIELLRRRLEDEKNTSLEDRERLEGLKQERDDLSRDTANQKRDVMELDAAIRDHARELLTLTEHSAATAQNQAGLEYLRTLQKKKGIPGLEDVAKLLELSFAEMEASSQILRRNGSMVDDQGNEIQGEILRLGSLSSIYRSGEETGYLILSPASGRLLMAGKPSWWIRRNLNAYLNGETEGIYLDISGGVAVRQLSRQETLWEQLLSGGPLIWPILFVGLVALILIIERLIFLGRVRINTDDLMTRVTDLVAEGKIEEAFKAAEARTGRPIGNVLQAGLAQRGQPRDVIESGLSEAILRETPRLERFLAALKVLAAVAPLLGLLGTVTGMINTFHVITMYGAGDPRLMAGGISEALITTQLGLAVAIPIMVVAALLSRRAHNLAADMEEKALALIAALLKEKD